MNNSYRRKVISLVESAVVFYNRAVNLNDLKKYAEETDQSNLCKGNLTATIGRLVHGRVLYIGKQGRRDKYGGNFYLPVGVGPEGYIENLPLTWLDIVWKSFQELWEEQEAEAVTKKTLPSPVITEDVESYILKNFGKEVFPPEKTPVAYALGYLCKNKPEAVLKKLRRSSFGRCLWVPASVSVKDYNLDGEAKNKSEIVNLVVRETVEEFNRPVTADEISKVTKLYPKYENYKRMSLFYSTRETKFSLIRNVGVVAGERYYYYGDISDEDCHAFITARRSRLEFNELCINKEIENISFCKLPSLAYGRLLLLKEATVCILGELQKIKNYKTCGKDFYHEVKYLINEIKQSLIQIEEHAFKSKIVDLLLPNKIVNRSILLNSNNLTAFLKPLLYKAENAGNASKIADITGREIRKHFNPSFEPCFIGTDQSNETSRYLFDRFDVLTYIANQVGGSLCRTISMIARAEMGNLRDERFLLPMLESNNYEQRLGAIACLAFLQNSQYESELYKIAINDIDAGVRQVALWAYAFVKGTHLIELIVKVAERENSVQVLRMAEQIEQMSLNDIWFI